MGIPSQHGFRFQVSVCSQPVLPACCEKLPYLIEADLLNDDVEAAYRGFVKIGRGGREDPLYASVGPPFFSKILYFLGKNLGMEKYPLILDTKVSIALASSTHGF